MKCTQPEKHHSGVDAACNGEMIEVGKIDHQVKAAYVLYQCESCGRCKIV